MNQKHTEEAAVRNISRAAFSVDLLMVTSSPAERAATAESHVGVSKASQILVSCDCAVSSALGDELLLVGGTVVGGAVGGGGSQNCYGEEADVRPKTITKYII